jgi:ParB family chromosome partitioning protein
MDLFLSSGHENQFPFGRFLDNGTALSQCACMSNSPLGRGLGALLGGTGSSKPKPAPAQEETPISYPPLATDQASVEPDLSPRQLPIDDIKPCSFQPRRHFEESALEELADSIREQGLIQPLVVRRKEDQWELIAGERRWRASRKAGLSDVPVIIRSANDTEVLELALVENLQRENLNPIEEALGYQQLIERFDLKQEAVALKVGKSRTAVTNALRLLKLPETVRDSLKEGLITVGHAKVLLAISEPAVLRSLCQRIIKEQLSVRQTEQAVSEQQSGGALQVTGGSATSNPAAIPQRDVHVAHLEQQLNEAFHTKVRLKYKEGKGSLEIHFFSEEELESILSRLGVSVD